jgi:hypothetical protein
MDDLFAIDGDARRRGLSIGERDRLRQQKAIPLVEAIREKIEMSQFAALPASALGKACRYALGLWRKLTEFLKHPILELSNNLAENALRPVAVGRKNWLHVGSPQAGPKIAAILSVVETCRRLKISAREYLEAVLPGLSTVSIQRLSGRTPLEWAARA